MRELILLLIYSIPVGFLLYTLINKKYRKNFLCFKIVCSSCFLVISFLCAIGGSGLVNYLYVFPAFFMCFAGDILLGFFNLNKRKKFFILGLLFFLTGHIFFLTFYCRIVQLHVVDVIFPICAVLVLPFFIHKRKMVIGKLKPFVFIYAFFVSFLFSKSMLLFLKLHTLQTGLLACGSFLFMISDLLILFLYFYRNRRWITHGLNLATYYYGMFLLALSLLYT